VSGADLTLRRPNEAVAIAGCAIVLGIALTATWPGTVDPLIAVLVVFAVVSRLITTDYGGPYFISAAFLCAALAAGLVGPAAAVAVPIATELVGWGIERYRRSALCINIASTVLPTALAATVLERLDLNQHHAGFYVALAVASLLLITANFVLLGGLFALLDGGPILRGLVPPLHLYPGVAVNIALITAIAAVYVQSGFAVLSLVLVTIIAFSYMMRLVMAARERTREYANLSWGVLSGLIRTLDARDQRAARHCAAVARFARDIARHSEMSERDQELAHTAGLLHDIGRFALSDRVMERGVTLTEDDWVAIRRHPEVGADLLRDIGVYGPLSEIIIAHHERPDGKGYPHGLTDGEIPDIAKIIAVAEVYDTLTAPDTYRTRLSSFEALTELRRVAGKQLDARYVEALAELLAGQGTDYRHADAADYDDELAIERRMNQAAGG
jgi:putative nucleotidyltransferase with HDIG domain